MKVLLTCLLFSILLMMPLTSGAQTTEQIHTVRSGETLFSISREYNINVEELRRWNNIRNNTIIVGQRLIVGQSTDASGAVRHTVRSGETLVAISRRYDVDVDHLRRANNLRSDGIRIGQVLVIPESSGSRTPAAPPEDTADARVDPPTVTPATEQAGRPPATQPGTGIPARTTETRPAETRQAETHQAERPAAQQERSLVVGSREGSAYYTVRPGDTLFRIASAHNMTLDELRRLNNLRGDVINVGQELLVRSETTTASIGAASTFTYGRFISHGVAQGENLQNLLDRFKMDRLDFETLNPGIDPDRLRPGLTVTVLEPPAVRQFNPYRSTVDAGDDELTPVTRYSDGHIGRTTTNGELYNPDQLTAAHASMPLGSVVFVQNPENGRGIYVLVNDRIVDESIRLSASAFQALDYAGSSRQAAVIVPTR